MVVLLPRYMLDNILAGMHPDRMTVIVDEEQPDGTRHVRLRRTKDERLLDAVYVPDDGSDAVMFDEVEG